MVNQRACIGLTMSIRKIPTAQPMKAPKIGISAVNAINTPIKRANGSLRTVSVIKNIVPRMTASAHCPVRNLEKIRSVIRRISSPRSTAFSGKYA